jgi:Protein of unknown function (DUF1236)
MWELRRQDAMGLPARLLKELISREKVHPKPVPVRVPSCCRSQFWEEWMHRTPIFALAMMVSLTAATTHAQAPAPPAAPQQELAPTGAKLNLTLEQRFTIREIIKDEKAAGAPANVQAAVGEPVPQGVTPQPMPSVVAQKVPQVKAHRYFLTAQQIVIVDPKDNKVAEVIKLTAD